MAVERKRRVTKKKAESDSDNDANTNVNDNVSHVDVSDTNSETKIVSKVDLQSKKSKVYNADLFKLLEMVNLLKLIPPFSLELLKTFCCHSAYGIDLLKLRSTACIPFNLATSLKSVFLLLI